MVMRTLSIGVDIEDLGVWERLVANPRWRWFAPLFAMDELTYCSKQKSRAASLGGLFAAKEAVLKALWPSMELTVRRIAISHYNERPVVLVDRSALCDWVCDVSISHSRLSVVAVCLARHVEVGEARE
jgi:phosphopantetheine--protein transferase-like protein